MTDDDFERTVEQLYGPNLDGSKPDDLPGKSTHVVELQPLPRPSMETLARPTTTSRSPVPPALPGDEADDRERAILESRRGANDRTSEWVAQHGTGKSLDAARRERSRSHSRAHRPHRSEPNALRSAAPGDGRTHRPPTSESRGQGDGDGDGDEGDIGASRESISYTSHSQRGRREGEQPRLEIPSSLMPAGPRSVAPTQVPFDLGPAQVQVITPHGSPNRASVLDNHGDAH